MKLRIWLPCILLIVIFIILVRNYFTDTEGFQASPAYTSPPAQTFNQARINFWSILSKYGTSGGGMSGSGMSGGGMSGSGMSGSGISNLLDQVMNPKPKDTFTMIFPKYVSMYALAKYNYDPVTARNVLINEYDTLQTELQTTVETEQASRALFASDPQGQSCDQINTMTMGFYGRLVNLYKGVQDLSGVVYNAGSFHDENLSLQNIVLSACTAQGALPSEDCKKLATMDEKLFPLLPRLDAINENILTDGGSIQDMINTLVQAYMGMGCRRLTGGSAPVNNTLSIDNVFSDTYIDSLGEIDTDFLSEKLQELSPYYVSPNIINYISGKLIGTSEFKSGLSDSLDYLKDMNKVTNSIVSLNTDRAPLQTGKFFSESGAAAGGFANCPAGYYCPVGSTMPIECPVGTFCPPGTTDQPIQCPVGTFSPAASTNESQCTTALPLGYYKDDTGKLIQCPTGAYCADGIRTYCPAGTYNMKRGMSSLTACLDCPKGSYCKTPTSITPCDAGKYNPNSRKSAVSDCISCPVGTSCVNKGAVTPTPCQPGTYSNVVGLKTPCTPVIQGYYLTGAGKTVDTTKQKCSAGYYCPGGTPEPIICPIGSYCYGDGLAKATPCPGGSYGSTLGLQSATCTGRCDAGYLCPPGSSSSTAIDCPEGYYCPAGTGTATICPTGGYCPRFSHSPISCPAGTYNPIAGKTNISDCLPCPPGKECGVGTTDPTPCRIGFYCPGGGDTNACIPGYYCDETGLQEPTPCPAGTYKPGTGYLITDCLPCRTGTWSNTPGEIDGCRETCPSGSYCPSPKSTLIRTILSTSFAAYPQATTQGSRRTISTPIGPTEPVPCPVGTYCPTAGMGVPTSCPAGTYSARTGQTEANTCQPCEPGKYCPTAGAGSQVLCPVGTFCPTQGASSPRQCLIGQMCPIPGLQAGSACPPGKLCDITGIGPPPPFKSCPPGTYSTGGAGTSCTNCPPGTFGSGDSTTSACSGVCPAGYTCGGTGITPVGGSNPPIPCPAGYYCPVGTPAPEPCLAGYYCPSGRTPLGGASPPLPCPVGHYCPVGTIGCPQGITPVNGKCCPDGMSITSNGCMQTVIPGAYTAGYYTYPLGYDMYLRYLRMGYPYMSELQVWHNEVWACDTATRDKDGNNCHLKPNSIIPGLPPLPCPDGTYGGGTGLARNTCSGQCPAGYYCTPGTTGISGSSTNPPKPCPSGKFCPAGTGGLNSSSRPQDCPAGTSGTPNSTSVTGCTTCPAGTFSSSGSPCTQCPAGTFSAAGAGSCTPCAAGTFSNTLGATTCTGRCPAGTFSTTLGATSSTTCTQCAAGTFSTAVGGQSSASCTQCPAGTFSATLGATSLATCTQCPAGRFSTAVGATSSTTCVQCNAGTYSASGSQSCTQCAPGTFSATAGTASCTQCAAGSYSDTAGRTACTGCPAGRYSTTVGAISSTTCLQCAAGSHSPSTGAASCTQCPAGRYSSTLGAASCDQCAAGTYSTAVGATSSATCTQCPAGRFSTAVGATSSATCTQCNAGTYSASGSQSCTQCAPRTFSATAGAASCTQCAAGSYNDNWGATSCISCPRGNYQPTLGGTCQSCPKGTYSDVDFAVSCKSCPAGTFGLSVNATSVYNCFKCVGWEDSVAYRGHWRGTYSTTVGASTMAVCQDCPIGTRASDDRTRCNRV